MLDDWLRSHALANEGRASRTYVVVARGEESEPVAAYYTLATASVLLAALPRKLRHNLPNPVPALLLGRLAVDHRHQGRGLGSGLLKEALLKTAEVSRSAGVRLLITHPIDEAAAAFYQRHHFRPLAGTTPALFLPIEAIVKAL